jgi:hypothetical protein
MAESAQVVSDSISIASSTSIEEPRPDSVAYSIAIAPESDLPTTSAGSDAGQDLAEATSNTQPSIDTVGDGLAMNLDTHVAFESTELQDTTDKRAAESQEEVAESSTDPEPSEQVEPRKESPLYDNGNTVFLSSSSSSISDELHKIVDAKPQRKVENENLQQAPADAAIKQVDLTKVTVVEQADHTKGNVESAIPAFSHSPASPGVTPRGTTALDGAKNLVAISYAFKIDSCEWTFGFVVQQNSFCFEHMCELTDKLSLGIRSTLTQSFISNGISKMASIEYQGDPTVCCWWKAKTASTSPPSSNLLPT